MILLTGASGFIGKHLLASLQKEFGEDKVLTIKHGRYHTVDLNHLKNVQVIVHAGSFTPKNKEQVNNVESCNSNIVSTQMLLSLQAPSLQKFIYLSTLDVYKNTTDPITETTEIEPESLYGLSKYYCEKMVEAWSSKNAIPAQILRIGHVYGPGEETYDKLIPSVMRNVLKDEDVVIYGDGVEYRSFIHVDDVVASIIKAVKLKQATDTINIVSDRKYTIRQVVEKILNIANHDKGYKNISITKLTRSTIFDNSRLKTQLHIPTTNLEDGLRAEWEHMKKLYENIF